MNIRNNYKLLAYFNFHPTWAITWASRFICDVLAHLCSGFWLPNYTVPELTRIRKHPVKYRGYTCGPRSHRNSSSSMEFVHRADTAGWTFPAKCSVICVTNERRQGRATPVRPSPSSSSPSFFPRLLFLAPRAARSSRLIHWLIHFVTASFMISWPFTAIFSSVHTSWN